MFDIVILSIILSLLNSIYLYINKNLYIDILPKEFSIMHIIYNAGIWIIFAYIINKYIVNQKIKFYKKILASAFLGFSIYFIHNLSNKIIFNDLWSWTLVFVDSLWGAGLFIISTIIYAVVLKRFK
jgi:hypothetical protein